MKTFEYKKLKYRYVSIWKKKWNLGFFIKKNSIFINEGSSCINYSQQCFEGLKSFIKKNKIKIKSFLNLFRFQKSSKYLIIPIFNIFSFFSILKILSILNFKYIPKKNLGFLYLRPLIIGTEKNIGVKTSKKFFFTIFCIPSFLNKYKINIKTIFLKRVIDNIGHYKIGSNYITNIKNNFFIKKYNFDDYIHNINLLFEEIGTSNIILYKKKHIISPYNKNILPGTNRFFFLNFFNKKKLRKIDFFLINNFKNFFSLGTASYLKKIKCILFKNKIIKYKNSYFNILIKYYIKIND